MGKRREKERVGLSGLFLRGVFFLMNRRYEVHGDWSTINPESEENFEVRCQFTRYRGTINFKEVKYRWLVDLSLRNFAYLF